MKKKYKSIQDKLGDGQDDDSSAEIEQDYDEIGRDFILVGGVHDPFSLRYEATITDDKGLEHKSAERYFWYKMAEFFNDADAMKAIREAPDFQSAEDAMKDIKDFKEDAWNEVRLKFWEEGQKLKFAQNRNVLNLLIYSGKTYIAAASQDKVIDSLDFCIFYIILFSSLVLVGGKPVKKLISLSTGTVKTRAEKP